MLDVGCGSGLSGSTLSGAGHVWVGADISADMLALAGQAHLHASLSGAHARHARHAVSTSHGGIEDFQETSNQSLTATAEAAGPCSNFQNPTPTNPDPPRRCGGLVCSDIGQAGPWRAGVFDAAVSISAVQWLLFRERWEEAAIRFFRGLHRSDMCLLHLLYIHVSVSQWLINGGGRQLLWW